ncbi:LOW QUALITY PROTEIN: alsin [Galleria mellonella]|uniref:LOW QUALITY PROTEIN: alsin n=1 Tax=Galleria mellonella TaxID=7137 RepID=A0ABM3N2P0_GALME|nr:LOW QUALITY PROTEIN: alsin [Galleria mellonella]
MSRHMFWRGLTPLEVCSSQTVPDKIVKLCSLGADFIVLGSDHGLYHCDIEEDRLEFRKIGGISAIDISYYNDIVYIIDVHGRLYKTNSSFKNKEEIVVKEDAKCCPHGFKSSSFKVKFRNVVTSDFGQLFISSDGQLWGSGAMPQIALDTTSIKKVPFFEGRTVYSASVGQNFAAVIARKNVKRSGNYDTESDNDDEEVFASNCSQCQTIIGLASPASVPSLSETCPLGVQISKSSEDSSSTTAPQTDVHVDAHSFTEDSSPSSEESKIAKYNIAQRNPNIETDHSQQDVKVSEDDTESPEIVTDTPHESTEKINNIFINTDAARQFLSRQLSWVSAGEDYLVEYTEKPTRIIKENVSNLTNFVYEGVKTVGDKVATLSRHVSGSSDNNEVVELQIRNYNEEINSLMYSCTSNCNFDDLQFSTSTISSEKEFEAGRKNENIKNMAKLGKNILATELWTWGDISYGQLGIGDTVKRIKPMVVMSLSGFGLQKVSCGKWHCSALTLDGRLFAWGYNHYHQVSFDSREDKSGPKQFTENSDSDRVRDMIATDHHTLAYTHNENIFYMGKHTNGFTECIVNLNNKADKEVTEDDNLAVKITEPQNVANKPQNMCYHWRILSSGNISYCSLEDIQCPEFQDLSIAQRYLEEMLLIYHSLIKPFLKKSKVVNLHSIIYETVCDIFGDILNITALNVLSMWQYAEKHIIECDISLIKNLEEYIYLYRKYYVAVSNLIVIGGFSQINSIVDVPSSIYNLFSDQLPSNKQKNNKKTLEAIVALAFVQPLTRLSSYKCIAQSILRYKTKRKKGDVKAAIEERLTKVISSLDSLIEEQEKKRKEADITKLFWETTGKSLEQYRTPERRLVRESKSRPLNLVNPGRFSSHWFVLFNDLFIHVNGSTPNLHPLETVWIESVSNTESLLNVIQLTTPEEVISLSTSSEHEKTEWLHAFNTSIRTKLNKDPTFKPPSIRSADYTFSSKIPFYKDSKYSGRWLDGKTHGNGRLEWPDGKLYVGQFQLNALCGHGKMEIPTVGIYEGQWKDNLQNGYGVMKYVTGDIYEGYFKDGQPHGHGIKKQGDFTSSSATIYTGEWVNGVKQGYGVMDDIGKGEKYLGNWSDNKKHGCGLIVTLDGIYYEGLFMQDVLTGHGVMVFEDGTHYEGEFRSAGVFSGKGVLTFSSGDKIEGSLSGAWTEGVKLSNATMHLNVSNPAPPSNSKPNSFGKLSVAPHQKWNALYRQCFQCLGVSDTILTPTGNHFANGPSGPVIDNVKIWQNVAVAISCSHKDKHVKTQKKSKGSDLEKSVDCLEVIPQFGQTSLNLDSYMELRQYLQNACESMHHPLGRLVLGLTNAFNTTYGGVRVHPLLLSHAVKELKSITTRLYQVVRLLFPALPPEGTDVVLPYNKNESSSDGDETPDSNPIEGEVVSAESLLQPTLLPRVHPALFVLYALHNKREDDLYWRRLLKWNRQPDITLMAFLGIDQKFWIGYSGHSNQMSPTYTPLKEQLFQEAVETLQQLKTTFSPIEKLLVIRSTFQKMTTAVQQELGENYLWSMDELFPVFHFVVVRARILQLGSEIHFVEDFLEPSMQHGELGLMFTTLKACYFQILQEKMTIN